MKKKTKPLIFIQEIPPYKHEMIVCVGGGYDEIIKWYNKNIKKDKKWLKWADYYKKDFNNVKEGKNLGYCLYEETNGWLILFTKEFRDTWGYWDTLLHELNHIVFWIAERKLLKEEMEAQAYLHEYLFREIRRKLRN